jgi:myo-inositol-1(or 4)-monophosphatase
MEHIIDAARSAALEAGEILRRYVVGELFIRLKSVNSIVTQVDVESEDCIVARIKKSFPNHEFFAEETHRPTTVFPEHLWIIDPLDGTTNFAHGIPHSAVSIAYAHGGVVCAGVVFDPFRNEIYHAVKGQGAFCNGKPIAVSIRTPLSDAVIATGFNYDRGEPMKKTLASMGKLLAGNVMGMRRTGCAALDLCWVACGRFDGYFEYVVAPWDYAAGALIAVEAGASLTDREGERHRLYSGSVITANTKLWEEFLKIVKWK